MTTRFPRERPRPRLQYSTDRGVPSCGRGSWSRLPRRVARSIRSCHHDGSQQALDLVSRCSSTLASRSRSTPRYIGGSRRCRCSSRHCCRCRSTSTASTAAFGVVVCHRASAAGALPVVTSENPTGATLSLERRCTPRRARPDTGSSSSRTTPTGRCGSRASSCRRSASWSDNVISLGTFSKLVVPGLPSWLRRRAPTWAREHLAKVKQGADLPHVELGAGLFSARSCRSGDGCPTTSRPLVRVYGTRAKALEDSFAARVGERFAFTRPDGGMFLWGRLSDGRSADRPAAEGRGAGDGLRARRALLLGAA